MTNSPDRRPEPYHIVAEVREPKNLEVARLVGRDEAELVLVPDLLARVTVQTCRQSGLSVVYQELLDYGGDEIYFKNEPAITGKTFGEVLGLYPTSSIIGLRREDGAIQLNPGMDAVVGAQDQVIAISADDDTVVVSKAPAPIEADAIASDVAAKVPQPEHTLILGWNDTAPLILRELSAYVAPRLARLGAGRVRGRHREGAEGAGPEHQPDDQPPPGRHHRPQDPRHPADPRFDHVILLSPQIDDGHEDEQKADARTLVTLLHLRDIREQSGRRFSIVSEMLDLRNRALAEVTRADDFIVGDQLASLLLTQISENKELNAVFTDLFDPEGSEIYLKPATDYVKAGREVSFATIVEAPAAAARSPSATASTNTRPTRTSPTASPPTPAKNVKVTLGEKDSVIVLAEDSITRRYFPARRKSSGRGTGAFFPAATFSGGAATVHRTSNSIAISIPLAPLKRNSTTLVLFSPIGRS